jgi:hypothetical protein
MGSVRGQVMTYRSTNVMLSAISATLFAMRFAMMAYALVTPFAGCVSPPATDAALFVTGCAFWAAAFAGALAIWCGAGRLMFAARGAAGFFGTPLTCAFWTLVAILFAAIKRYPIPREDAFQWPTRLRRPAMDEENRTRDPLILQERVVVRMDWKEDDRTALLKAEYKAALRDTFGSASRRGLVSIFASSPVQLEDFKPHIALLGRQTSWCINAGSRIHLCDRPARITDATTSAKRVAGCG